MWYQQKLPVLTAGISPPKTTEELIWYFFGFLAAYFLWSIKRELTGMREDLKEERSARELIALKVAALEARCNERGCGKEGA